MNRLSPRRFFAFLRRTSLLDRVALVVLVLYVVARVAGSLRFPIPFTAVLGFLSFVAMAYFVVRLLPWFRNQMLWRLRNRLIVAYILIAVVPVILLLTMAAVATSGLYLQLGAHLLQDDLQQSIRAVSVDAEAVAGVVERELAVGGSLADQSILSRPAVTRLLAESRRSGLEVQVFLNRGQNLPRAHGAEKFEGLAEWDNQLWVAAAVSRATPQGSFSILVGAPLDSELLDGLSSELGPIQLILLRPVEQKPAAGTYFDFNNRLYAPGEKISSKHRPLAQPASWLDIAINGASTFEVVHAEPGQNAAPGAVFASFLLRPSALSHRLLSSVGELGPLLEIALVAAAVVFLIIEIVALVTGVVLTRTITRAVGDLYQATLSVRRGDLSHRVRVHKRDQLGALGESFNEMTASVAELIEEQKRRQRLENEISIAREVQAQLFPQTLPSLPGLQLAAVCRPARVVSGDYYDFIRLGPSRVAIALADISGKGIFAALLMASLQAVLRSTASINGQGTAALVARLNEHLLRNTSDDRYATFFYSVYDAEARTLTYTNAGHLAPFFLSGGSLLQLDDGGTVVGLIEESKYTQRTIQVQPGSLLVTFSDGLTEPENVYGEEFGIARLREEVLRQATVPPAKLAESLIAAADQWAGAQDQADDITVVIARMG